MSELNLARRETYRKRFSIEEKTKIFQHWTEIMNATKADMLFFDFINEFYPETKFDEEPCSKIKENMVKTITKHKWITEDKTIVLSNHPPLDNLIIKHFESEVIAAGVAWVVCAENSV